MKSKTAFNLGVLCERIYRIANNMNCEELINIVNKIEKLMEKEDEEEYEREQIATR